MSPPPRRREHAKRDSVGPSSGCRPGGQAIETSGGTSHRYNMAEREHVEATNNLMQNSVCNGPRASHIQSLD